MDGLSFSWGKRILTVCVRLLIALAIAFAVILLVFRFENWSSVNCDNPESICSQVFSVVQVKYVQGFSILTAAFLYVLESPERIRTRIYEAWQVIDNAAAANVSTSYARIRALEFLKDYGISLERLNLESTDLQQINLTQVNLKSANLSCVDLREAKLKGINLSYADLTDADLSNAIIRGGKFNHTNLEGANLNNADLRGVNFSGANLRSISLRGALLENAIFKDTDLKGSLYNENTKFPENFNPDEIPSKAIANGAEALLLIPSVNKINQAMEVARANQNSLVLLGNHSMYTYETLDIGQSNIKGAVLPTAWHPTVTANSEFNQNALKLWGMEGNWRTATAYDATKAILNGLSSASTRQQLQQALANSGFSVPGALGEITFKPSGDRQIDATRSEERRVGKECRSRWSPYH